MKKYRNLWFYLGIVGGCSILIYIILAVGNGLEDKKGLPLKYQGISHWNEFYVSVKDNFHHPLAVLLAQIVTIILMARLFGWLCKLVGQPTVVGEVIAGVILGPSLVGIYLPQVSAVLFPVKSMGNLNALSQVGLILYMFIVGMELDLRLLRKKALDVMIISHASIIIPFALGMTLAYFIYQEFAPENISFSSFGLFMGIAMSVTALPVLARIVQERGMSRTRLGMLAITCAAADDITAWCLLSAVIAIVKAGSFLSSLYTIGLSVAYVIFMIKVVKPFVQRITGTITDKLPPRAVIGMYFLVLVLSSFATELIGIHALFGGFMAGLIMPAHQGFRKGIINKLEDLTLLFLLPLFFVYTGLRTEIGLLSSPGLWLLTLVIICVAVLGKFVGTTIAARFVGQGWKDSLVIGILMNTRGLMELIVLNIGYDLGVLTPEVFTMLVIMALVTTAITGPALNFLNRIFKVEKAQLPIVV
ncbi:MAG TPA: cation:proton antiporter [Flavitalea sp.]|nr:cation:proton antiporter [Flavitalea sp.]